MSRTLDWAIGAFVTAVVTAVAMMGVPDAWFSGIADWLALSSDHEPWVLSTIIGCSSVLVIGLMLRDHQRRPLLRMRALLEATPQPAMILAGGRVVAHNDAAILELGISPKSAVINDDLAALTDEEFARRLRRFVAEARQGSQAMLALGHDSQQIECVCAMRELWGRRPLSLVLMRNLDEAYRYHQDLIVSEQRFQSFMAYSPMPAWALDGAGRFRFVNRRYAEDIAGQAVNELVGSPLQAHRTSMPSESALAAVVDNLEPFSEEASWEDAEGRLRHYRVHSFPIEMPDGSPLIGGYAVDLTDELNARNAHASAERRLQIAMEAGDMGTWSFGGPPAAGAPSWGGTIEIDAALSATLDIERRHLSLRALYGRLTPESRVRLRAAIEASREYGRGLEIELEIISDRGATRRVTVRGERQAGGRASMVGVAIDLTATRNAERWQHLSEMAVATAIEPMLILDAEGCVIFGNPAYRALVGEPGRGCERPPLTLAPEGRPGDAGRTIFRHLREHDHDRREGWVITAEGESRPVQISTRRARHATFGDHYVMVMSDLAEIYAYQSRLHALAHFDSLTGLANRKHFEHSLANLLAEAGEAPVGVIFIDLDHFKAINDSLGHGVGDDLLRAVAERLQRLAGGAGIVGRFGGDEFCMALNGIGSADALEAFAEQLVEALGEAFHIDKLELFCGASVGIALAPDEGREPEALIMSADAAMYEAKSLGRNRAVRFEPDIALRAGRHVELASDLRSALAHREFRLVYQPIVEGRSGTIVGCEALIRWSHPRLGEISPATFIPVAEETGLIGLIGEWVLAHALERLAAWQFEQPLGGFRMAINLSARQFHQERLAQQIAEAIARHAINPASLTFEITETALMKAPEKAARQIERLQALGVSIALDDFGTGYSSLNYLKDLDIDCIKIDRSFIRGLPGDSADTAITSAMLAMAEKLGLSTVAEGVEGVDQREALLSLGFEKMQGFYFARPMEEAELIERLRSQGSARALPGPRAVQAVNS